MRRNITIALAFLFTGCALLLPGLVSANDDDCDWVFVPDGNSDCYLNDMGEYICTPHYDLLLDCDGDGVADNPPNPPGGGSGGGGAGDPDCPAQCPNTTYTFRELSGTVCDDCDHVSDPLLSCHSVVEFSSPCPTDGGSRDCCEVLSCVDMDDRSTKCRSGGRFPDSIGFSYFLDNM